MKKRLTYILAGLALLTLGSCGDFLKEYSQDTDYVRSWRDLDELLIGSAYQPIFSAATLSNVADNQYFVHFLADELDETTVAGDDNHMSYDGKERVFGYYTWQARSGQNDTYTGYNKENQSWEEYYKLINVANNVIASAADMNESNEEDRKGKLKVDGEAHFLRAYYYFMLTNMYARAYTPETAATDLAVPLKTSEVVEDRKFQRNTVEECYDLILSDLMTAEKELDEYGPQKSKFRADATAVRLLLSRVYLYMQNWKMAAEYAQKVIDAHPGLANLNKFKTTDGIISTTSPELIFSMGSNAVMEYTINYSKSFQISDTIYQLYADNDLRKTMYIWTNGDFHGYKKVPANEASIATSGHTEDDPDYYFDAYYYGYQNQTNEVSDKNYFRSAEAYLNLAEAEACQGHDAAAQKAVNHLRQYRYADGANFEITSTGEQLIRDIRDERARELLLEGHRWFDLRRYAVSQIAPQASTITHRYYYYQGRDSSVKTALHIFKLTPDDWGWTLPIPQTVIEYNQMQQNERGTRTHTSQNL